MVDTKAVKCPIQLCSFFQLEEEPIDREESILFQTLPAYLLKSAHILKLIHSVIGFADKGVNLPTLN